MKINELKFNEIYKIDCLDGLKELKNESIDLIVTSPPYADRREGEYKSIKTSEYVNWFIPIAKELYRVLKPSGSFFINIKSHCSKGERELYVYELVIALKKELGWRFVDEFTWTKNGVPGRFKGRFKNGFEPIFHFAKSSEIVFNPYAVGVPMKEESLKRANRKATGLTKNGSGFAGMRRNETMVNRSLALPSNHLHIPQKSNQYTLQSKHPAVFPVELPEFFIKAFTYEGQVVLDPFMGSGTTAIASEMLGRKWIGFETEAKYIEIANERLRGYANSK
ncbi:DNA-methyltransferase [Bacillus velezensis]|uniref:DNA-methyltransferase n=1 Tax=Bacillus velezensis TaxID=492670 RepID=UPI000CE00C17|nr:site-specific DNA-methyltransferase [Bacillus velezensis]AVB11517.1 site-specific DNA-methyltransferase [Bacillus velezensis]MCV2523110.1 site-specific DNA-methyltransferase [Bacillus velezensis]MEC0382972.1 site-specific DNA-methyltransferase [Bacillus velezensis]MEC0403127.1 site-specific DNA-methyltransferase [Bacillus velezensis]MEC3924467.1 site-specific DNA-methyltransferase [Bacillus velezensis]